MTYFDRYKGIYGVGGCRTIIVPCCSKVRKTVVVHSSLLNYFHGICHGVRRHVGCLDEIWLFPWRFLGLLPSDSGNILDVGIRNGRRLYACSTLITNSFARALTTTSFRTTPLFATRAERRTGFESLLFGRSCSFAIYMILNQSLLPATIEKDIQTFAGSSLGFLDEIFDSSALT